ncbi:MAG: HAD-IC family P-type ATPase [Anaeroplasma sp.]
MARPNIDDLSEEELSEYLDKNSNEDMVADETDKDEDTTSIDAQVYKDDIEPIVISSNDIDEIDDSVKKDKESKRIKKEREKLIKKHRKSLNKNPSKLVRYDTDPEFGLPKDVVDARTIDGLVNETNTKSSKSIPKIIISNVFTFFNLLIFFIATCLILVGAYTDLVFLFIVSVNIIIGILQEIKAKNTIDKLSLMSAPTAVVKRNGNNYEIAVNEIVLDDLLLLENGKQICADSIVVDGSVEVNESLLTGEADAILKKPGDILYSGSFVVSGRCSARVDKIGKDNYIERLSSQAKKYKKPKSDLLFSLNFIIKFMFLPIIVIGASLFFIMYHNNFIDLTTSVRKTAGAMIGMIPSGLFLMSSLALLVGVIRLGEKNVLVQELYCIEMLARVNCICLDKTGTITDGTMSVKNVIDYNTIYGLATKNIISAMLNALHDNNLTSQALKDKFGLGKRIKHIAAIPFSSQRKYQAVTFDKYGTFILGAPEFVLKEEYNRYKNDVNKYASLGYRVLCLAYKEGTIVDGNLPETKTQVVSMILIEDNIRPDAVNTIKYFKDSGVQVRVISGDNPITVSKISQRAGIDNADSYISLDGMSDQEVIRVATKYTVFGRVSPAQKKLLIQTLKESGLTVAMTGDGVNDILALKEADCSIAVASGSEAARNCSHLVLVDSNFDSMPFVVAEGRRVINNVTTVSSLFLTKTIFSLFLAIQALINGSYPISTNQLFLIDTLAIGLPSLVLVIEPNNEPVKGRFLFNVIKEALPGALTILMISIIVFGLADGLYLDNMSLITIIVISATHTCLMVLFKACKPFNTKRKRLCTLCYSLFLIAIIILPQFFEFRPLIKLTEYYSPNITNETICNYPTVEISREGFYVVDGKVISLQNNANYKNINLSAINGDSKDPNEANKLYYAINGTKIDTLLNIPELTYTKKGEIMYGGYVVENHKYTDDFEKNLIITENGDLEYVSKVLENGDIISTPVKIKLSKTDEAYNFYIKYGNYKESDAIKTFNLMPTVEIKNDEYIINGVQSVDYKYKVPTSLSEIFDLDVKIGKEYDKNKNFIGYQLLINGSPIYATMNDGTISQTPYRISLPTVSTTADKTGSAGTIYLNAVSTEYTIFEIYGKENLILNPEDLSEEYTYTIKYMDYSGKMIDVKYEKKTNNIYYNGELANDFTFSNLKLKGFKNYYDVNDEPIDVNSLDNPLLITAKSGDTVYSLKLGDTIYKLGIVGSLDNVFVSPDISITADGNYIINGYYTNFTYSSNSLNPQKDKDNYLVLGGIKTDYQLTANDLIITKGGIVRELSVSSKIFLLMLCLISAPVMKIFQYCIPWIINQARIIKGFLGKN